MSDEKDARGYLQALAGKMSEELDGLKVVGFGGGGGAASVSNSFACLWRERI